MNRPSTHTQALEFLPAVLEIQETPPLPISRWILWLIILFFAIAVAWACIGHVNVVAVAHGKLVPSSHVKVIQPLESGVVRNIHVREGERVEAGQLLIELDSTATGADREMLASQLLAMTIERSRLLTLLQVINEPPSATISPYGASGGPWIELPEAATRAQVERHSQRLHAQYGQYRSHIAALNKDEAQKRAELEAINRRIEQLDAIIPMITERSNSLKTLLDQSMAPRMQWLETEEQRITQIKEREVQTSNRLNVSAAIEAIRQRRESFQAEFRQQRVAELTEIENRINELEQTYIKAKQRFTLQQLRAPVTGIVDQLAVHTIGGVVTPAQDLMTIVPEEDPIEVQAWIENKDIGFVDAGQNAKLKVETFQFTKYGTIDAEIINISHDAVSDEVRGLVYEARLRPDTTVMDIEGRKINLSPGMAVSVEVNIGERRLIEYLLSPLLRFKSESFGER